LVTLGEIFRAHGPEYRNRFADRMSLDQLRTMRDIEDCHTPAAGKALWLCPACKKRHFTYVGCSNRHCPACGSTRAGQWLRKHSALLLPGCVYHLVTFTVPAELRRRIRSHPRELLELLMRESAGTLLDLCANDRWLGATPGLTAVLHTWTRQGEYHPHVHFIATGGGLDQHGQWNQSHPRFLVPVRALSSVFRARMRDGIRDQYPELFVGIKTSAWKHKKWVVNSKPTGSGQETLAYLARYVYRVALSQRDIVRHETNLITLHYRKSGSRRVRTLKLLPQEFLRRFLQHVLPRGFRKVRYFGLHHSSKRSELKLLQASLSIQAQHSLPAPTAEPAPQAPACPHCQTQMVLSARLTASGLVVFSTIPDLTQRQSDPTRGPP
jgi:hypothetical protein